MPARSGQEYVESLKKSAPCVYLDGRRVEDVTAEPVFREPIRAIAEQYDMQLDPAYGSDDLPVADDGDPVSTSFLVPYTRDELVKKRKHFKLRADHNFSGASLPLEPRSLLDCVDRRCGRSGIVLGHARSPQFLEGIVHSMTMGLMVFACVFGGALFGQYLSAKVSAHHLSADSKDAMKMALGVIGTLAALVLGLLLASAKSRSTPRVMESTRFRPISFCSTGPGPIRAGDAGCPRSTAQFRSRGDSAGLAGGRTPGGEIRHH